MRLGLTLTSLGLSALLWLGCGTDDPGMGNNPDASRIDAGPNDPDADPGGWTELITASWTNPAATERYRCARKTVTQDLYIQAFRPLSPLGTHHTVVSIDDPNGADGEYDCSAGALTHTMLFASGVGTDDLAFPLGVAVKVPAGKQINLNIHLFNISDSELNGTTGTLVRLLPAAEVVHEAEMVFGGTVTFSIPPNQQYSAAGNCSLPGGTTIASVWPHEHQIGDHMTIEVMRGGQPVEVLHDQPFSFDEQIQWPITPFTTQAGDQIRTTCTWNNTTGRTITFGDSSNDEMCLSGLYIYPPRGQGLWCLL